jgi:23S rRNA (uracil1939-C5)-methyltransferase
MPPFEVKIEKLIYGGDGLAHHEGATVFVPFVLPAERVAALAIEQKKKFIRAQPETILEASPERIAARCPHFGVCGGCNYQHIPYSQQLEYKTEILRETLRRIGRIEWTAAIATHSSPQWEYRNRAQWKIRPAAETEHDANEDGARQAGKGAKKEEAKLAIGYFRANSTALCAVEDCSILAPSLLSALLALRNALAQGKLHQALREVEVFGAEATGASPAKLLMTATFAGFAARAAELAAEFRSIVPQIESLLFHDPGRDRMELFGPGFLEYEAGGEKYRVGHFSFFQVNRFLAGAMAEEVAQKDEGGKLALDLFAGVGLFSLPLAGRFERVVAVEANPAAARDLENNVRGKGAIEVRNSDVDRFLERCKEKPDLVVLDPPRAGMTPDGIRRLARIAPARITYVSCDPSTLARDLAALIAGGYELAEMQLFDLFPQTFHMETIARLRRRE